MKTNRKLMALVLMSMMIFSMMMPAFAVDTYSITITNNSPNLTMAGNTYKAYEVFNLVKSTDGSSYLYSPAPAFAGFTYNNKPAAELPALVATFTNDSVALNDFAEAVNAYITTNNIAAAGTAPGAAGNSTTINVQGSALGYYIITAKGTAEGNQTVTALCALTTTDPTATVALKADVPTVDKFVLEDSNGTYGKLADYSVGQDVPFRITGTVPSYVGGYDTYKYIFHDQLEAGFTLKDSTIKVFVGSDPNTRTELVLGTDFTMAGNATNSKDFTISSAIIKANVGKNIYVEYNATLDQDAEIHSGINTGPVKLEYSNNPYDSATTGMTPLHDVGVYTYKFDIFKYTGTNTPLAGAKFKLMEGANEIKLVNVSDNNYRVAQDAASGVEMVSPANGVINIIGLDEGTFSLVETEAPVGYNKADPIPVIVTAQNANYAVFGTIASFLVNGQDGTLDATQVKVLNQTGTLLPTTGGMGTVMFYVAGFCMMMGAAVLLITKKRLANK